MNTKIYLIFNKSKKKIQKNFNLNLTRIPNGKINKHANWVHIMIISHAVNLEVQRMSITDVLKTSNVIQRFKTFIRKNFRNLNFPLFSNTI